HVLHSFPTRRSSDLIVSTSNLQSPIPTSGHRKNLLARLSSRRRRAAKPLILSIAALLLTVLPSHASRDNWTELNVGPFYVDTQEYRKSTRLNSSHVK